MVADIEKRQISDAMVNGDVYDMFKEDISRNMKDDGNIEYNTGQLLRTDSLRLIKEDGEPTKGLYAVGVTASKFGITRAKAMFQEGEIVGQRLTQMREE